MTDERSPQILKWKSHKVYQCRMCKFDSLDKARFEDHIRLAHPPLRVIDGGKKDEPDAPAKSKSKEAN